MVQLILGHWQLIFITALIFILWSTPIVAPLKILTVFLHELSHALATLLTGGSVENLSINPNQGGSVLSRGGNRFIILSAGYLGSLLFGLFLVLSAVRTGWDRATLGLLGGAIMIVTLIYVREPFGIAFGCAAGAGMVAIAWFLGRAFADPVLRILGVTSMIYVPFDIFSDTIARSHLQSDARMLAEEFGGPTLLWGGAWLGLSLIAIWICLRYGLGVDSNIRLSPTKSDGSHTT